MKILFNRIVTWFFDFRGYRVISVGPITAGKNHIWLETSLGRIRKPFYQNLKTHDKIYQ